MRKVIHDVPQDLLARAQRTADVSSYRAGLVERKTWLAHRLRELREAGEETEERRALRAEYNEIEAVLAARKRPLPYVWHMAFVKIAKEYLDADSFGAIADMTDELVRGKRRVPVDE